MRGAFESGWVLTVDEIGRNAWIWVLWRRDCDLEIGQRDRVQRSARKALKRGRQFADRMGIEPELDVGQHISRRRR